MSQAIEDALHAWVMTATGLAGDHVIWLNQDVPRPLDPYCTLKMESQDLDGAFDQIEDFTDLTRPAGQEVELRVTGWRELFVQVEAFSHTVSGDGTAKDMLDNVQTKLAFPSIRQLLNVAGLGPAFDRGTIRNVPQLLGTSRFESRAIVTIGFWYALVMSDYTTYIETVNGTGDLQGTVNPASGTVDISVTGS